MDVDIIREAVVRHPFEPFTLRLNDGREYYVAHPEQIAVSKRVVVLVDQTEATTWFEPLLIATMQLGRPKKNGKNGRKKH